MNINKLKIKYTSFIFVVSFIILMTTTIDAFSQKRDVRYIKTVEDISIPKPDIRETNMLRMRANKYVTKGGSTRPKRVDNSLNKFFPPIFNQDGGSCGSASRISYMLTYELNAYRNLPANVPENQYPSHFTWLQTSQPSEDKGMTAKYNGVPNVVDYGGRTYSSLFGNQENTTIGYGRMQGYYKWYNAMHNRLEKAVSISGLDVMRDWLWNHCGDTSFQAGGIIGVAYLSTVNCVQIPAKSYEGGKWIVAEPFNGYDHATTIVGYDDDIEFDINKNGTIEDDEKGAWIVANSWGDGWRNKGFIYLPYKFHSGGELYYIRKDYKPQKTIRITMKYSDRNKIKLKVGHSVNPYSVQPENVTELWSFRYDGNNDSPMLGKWTDGWHRESMDFGYDLTDFMASIPKDSKYQKWFFIVESSSAANGTGAIDSVSIKDYVNGVLKKSVRFPENNVTINNKGRSTIMTMEVGSPADSPADTTKHPFGSDYVIKCGGYADNIYFTADYNLAVGKMNLNTTAAQPHSYFDVYSVVEVYDDNGKLVYTKEHKGKVGSEEHKTIPVKVGYRIKIKHAEGDNGKRFFVQSSLLPSLIGSKGFSGFQKNAFVTFEITEYGLKAIEGGTSNDPKDMFYDRTCEYFNSLINSDNANDLCNASKLLNEKRTLLSAYNLLSSDQKKKFETKFEKNWPLNYCTITIKNSGNNRIIVKNKSGKMMRGGEKVKSGSELYISAFSSSGGKIKEIKINKTARELTSSGNIRYIANGNLELTF